MRSSSFRAHVARRLLARRVTHASLTRARTRALSLLSISYHVQVLVTDPLEGALTSLWNVSAFVETTVGDMVRREQREHERAARLHDDDNDRAQ